MLALLFPGQGSQTPGMLNPWLNDQTQKLLASWSKHIDLDLIALGTTATADEIKDTDRKSTRLNSSHTDISRMPSSA